MKLSERDRAIILRALEDVLGEEVAEVLMTQLPPSGWDDVVTKDDLAGATRQLGARMDGLETRMGGLDARMDGLDARIDHLEEKMDTRFEAVHSDLDRTRHEVLATIRGEMITAVTHQTRTIIFTMAGTVVSLMGFMLGLEHLG